MRQHFRRIFWTAVILAGALAIVLTLAIGIPYAMMRAGLSREFGWSAFRVGHREIHRRVDLSDGERIERTQSGPIIAFGGDVLELEYRIEPYDGSPNAATLTVRPLLGVDPAWREAFSEPASGTVEVPLDDARLYLVTVGYTAYLGRVELDWRVR